MKKDWKLDKKYQGRQFKRQQILTEKAQPEQLEALAQAATPGERTVETVPTSTGHCHKIMPMHLCIYADNSNWREHPQKAADAAFIAACSPDVILTLVARIRELEAQIEK